MIISGPECESADVQGARILSVHTYMHTYIHAYIHTYIHTYIFKKKQLCNLPNPLTFRLNIYRVHTTIFRKLFILKKYEIFGL